MEKLSDTQTTVNNSATSDHLRTPLTQVRSPGVHGSTYFIFDGTRIKIGFSMKPAKRIKGIARQEKKEMKTLLVVPAELADEYKTHQLFKHLRIEGEWFRPEPDLLGFIEKLKIELANAAPDQPAKAPAPMDIKTLTARLTKLRNAHGHETPVGHTCSNLLGQIPAMAGYVRPAWATHECQTLPWMIQGQMKRLASLKAASN